MYSTNHWMRFYISRCCCYRCNRVRFVRTNDTSSFHHPVDWRWLVRSNDRWFSVRTREKNTQQWASKIIETRSFWMVVDTLTDALNVLLHAEVVKPILEFEKAYPHTRSRAARFRVWAPPVWPETLVYPIVDYYLTDLIMKMMWVMILWATLHQVAAVSAWKNSSMLVEQ